MSRLYLKQPQQREHVAKSNTCINGNDRPKQEPTGATDNVQLAEQWQSTSGNNVGDSWKLALQSNRQYVRRNHGAPNTLEHKEHYQEEKQRLSWRLHRIKRRLLLERVGSSLSRSTSVSNSSNSSSTSNNQGMSSPTTVIFKSSQPNSTTNGGIVKQEQGEILKEGYYLRMDYSHHHPSDRNQDSANSFPDSCDDDDDFRFDIDSSSSSNDIDDVAE